MNNKHFCYLRYHYDSNVLRTHLRVFAEAVLQLPVGGEEPGPVGLQLIPLAAEAELHGEPVALRKEQRAKIIANFNNKKEDVGNPLFFFLVKIKFML